MNEVKFSVLLSIYYKENPDYFRECMESIYSQTVLPDEIVLVEDGRLTDELYEAISEYECRASEINFVTVKLEKNSGLGLALAEGIKHCSNELVARMDTDDICVPDRFERQLKVFSNNNNLDVVGGFIAEFDIDKEHIVAERKVPLCHNDIVRYQRKRDGLNHVSVMFKRKSVLDAGNYKNCLLMEDSLLWANMIKNHCHMANIDEVLVYVRTGDDMLKRRGGFDYFIKYRSGRRKILQTGTISMSDYFITVAAQFVVCMMPLWMRSLVFKKILRN
nr:glycosyltransferase [uncultured Agathobacter sp.]